MRQWIPGIHYTPGRQGRPIVPTRKSFLAIDQSFFLCFFPNAAKLDGKPHIVLRKWFLLILVVDISFACKFFDYFVNLMADSALDNAPS
jgi:hypothetical protein